LNLHLLRFELGAFLVALGVSGLAHDHQFSLLGLQVLSNSLSHKFLSVNLVLECQDSSFKLRLLLFVEAVPAGLSAINKALLVLNVQFGFNFSFVDQFLLLRDVQVVLVLLLGGLIFGLALILSDLLDLLVQVFLFLAEAVELLLLVQLLNDIVGEGFIFQFAKFVLEAVIPVD